MIKKQKARKALDRVDIETLKHIASKQRNVYLHYNNFYMTKKIDVMLNRIIPILEEVLQ